VVPGIMAYWDVATCRLVNSCSTACL